MPYRESSVGVRAVLPFHHPEKSSLTGQIVLRDDGMLQLVPSPALRRDWERTASRIDQGALKWGTSLVVGLAAVGTALFWRRQRGPAYAVFAASGLSGAGAFAARYLVRSLDSFVLLPVPREQVRITPDLSGGLRILIDGGGVKKFLIPMTANQFDPGKADAFIKSLLEFDKSPKG